MKQFFFLTVIFLTLTLKIEAQGSENIFTINNDTIITNSDFIDPFFSKKTASVKYYLNENDPNVLVGKVEYNVKVGSYTYSPGNFDVLEISKNGVRQCLYCEDAGILKSDYKCLRSSMEEGGEDLGHSERSDYYMEFSLSPTTKGLLFFCNSYGTDVGRTLIFILTQKEAKLVFNKKMKVVNLGQSVSNFILWSTYMEFNVDGTIWEQPNVYSIWDEGDILKFKTGNNEMA